MSNFLKPLKVSFLENIEPLCIEGELFSGDLDGDYGFF